MDISVVLVTCNRPLNIFLRAYNSVCNQSHSPKEFIIVNSGTNELPGNIRGIIINVPNSNASVARNLGAKYTTSEYIAFLDDDDEWLPTHLESHLKMINCYNNSLIYSHNPDKSIWNQEEKDIYIRNWIGATSFVSIPRIYFIKVGGFDESFVANQEWDLWIRLCKYCDPLECDSPTVIKYDSPDAISKNISKRIMGWNSILLKYMKEYKLNPQVFFKVTQVFRDEMYLKHSFIGMWIAFKWYRRSKKLLRINKNRN